MQPGVPSLSARSLKGESGLGLAGEPWLTEGNGAPEWTVTPRAPGKMQEPLLPPCPHKHILPLLGVDMGAGSLSTPTPSSASHTPLTSPGADGGWGSGGVLALQCYSSFKFDSKLYHLKGV